MKKANKNKFLVIACTTISLQAAYSGNGPHSFRPGDSVMKQQVAYKAPGRSGQGVLWNLGGMNVLNDSYEVDYTTTLVDSVIAGTEHDTRYYYTGNSGELQLLGYENRTTKVVYSNPETILRLPLVLGDKTSGTFSAITSYSERLAMRLYGTYEVETDATGMLILPESDTLRHVTRVHSRKIMAKEKLEHLPLDTAIQHLAEKSRLLSPEMIISKLQDDSTSLEINTYRWYAEGYRYPVYETVTTGLVGKGALYATAYYWPPENMESLDDAENESLRRALDKNNVVKKGNNAADNKGFGESSGNANHLHFNYNACLQCNQTLSVEFFNSATVNVLCSVYSANGMLISEQSDVALKKGVHAWSFDLSKQHSGIYLIRLIVNGEIYTEKVAKK